MPDLTLEFIIQALGGQSFAGATPVGEAVFDSRDVTPGSLFVALEGESTDGHRFAREALERGAAAAIVDRALDAPYPVIDLRRGAETTHEPPLQTPVLLRVEDSLLALQEAARQWMRCFDTRTIGITGSVGKTTTKELVAEVLDERYVTLKSEKSYNNEIGLPVTALKLNDACERLVLEMSMYDVGEIALLCGIAPPHVGVVTMIAPVHLERARTMERIIDAKAELVEALPPAPEGIAILNIDDQAVMSLAGRTRANVLTYGLNPQADFWADRIEGLGLDGIRFRLHHADTQRQIKLPMLGRHSVHTALRAAAVGWVEGLSWAEIATGLQTSHSQLRLLAVTGPRGSVILDDTYNASPPSTIAALNLLNDLIEGRRIAVLGDMLELGSYEAQGHEIVGIRAAAVVSLLVTVGERGKIIAQAARRAGMPAGDIRVMDSAEEAAEFLLAEIRPGDTVLVKGSRAIGMERVVGILTEQTAAGEPGKQPQP